MYIIEDTRNKTGKHTIKNEHFADMGISVIRSKLPFGDYSIPPKIVVDTKKGLEEIAGNICGNRKEHERFKKECVNARDAGCKLVFLVENNCGISSVDDVHTWINPNCIFHPECAQGDRLEKAMKTMQERYGCMFLFCSPEESAKKIIEILSGGD